MAEVAGRLRFAAGLYRYRWPAAVGTVAVCLVLGALGWLQVDRLTGHVAALGPASDASTPKLVDPRYDIWFADGEAARTYHLVEEEFGSEELLVVAVEGRAVGHGPVATTGEDLLRLKRSLANIPGVVGVSESTQANGFQATLWVRIDRYQTAQRSASEEDGKSLVRALYAVDAQRLTLQRVESVLAAEAERSGLRFHIAGFPVNEREFERMGFGDMQMQGLVFAGVTIVLWFVLRSLLLVLLALATVAVSLVGMLGTSLLLGDLLNNLTIIAPLIVTAVGIADAIHLLSSYRTRAHRFRSAKALVTHVLATNLLPVSLTSVTTALGFFSLTMSNLAPVRMLGYTAGIGTLFAFALSMTLVPAVLSTLRVKPSRGLHTSRLAIAEPLARWVVNRKGTILAAVGVIVLVAVWGAAHVQLETDSRAFFPKGNEVHADIIWVEEHVGGFGSVEILLRRPVGDPQEWVSRVLAFEHRLRAETADSTSPLHIVTNIISPFRLFEQQHAPLQAAELSTGKTTEEQRALVRLLGDRYIRVILRMHLAPSETHLAVAQRIETIAEKELGQYGDGDISLGGKFLLYAEMFRGVQIDYLKAILVALLTITTVIGIAFRSVRMALISALSNTLPVLLPLSVYGLLGWPVDAPAVFVSSLALGVCVDDTIHFLAAVRFARQSGFAGVRALCCALANVGHALVTTTIVLVVGFGVLIGAEFRPNVVIGQLAVPMFALALFTTLFITPALLCVLAPGRRQKEELPKTALIGSSGALS